MTAKQECGPRSEEGAVITHSSLLTRYLGKYFFGNLATTVYSGSTMFATLDSAT
jgi:hypothetical protein